MLACMWYTELTCIPYWAKGGHCGSGPRPYCVCVCACVRACVRVCVCVQLSAKVVFMKLSENLFFQVVLDFELLPHP